MINNIDTIYAIASGSVDGSISIIRISGKDAFSFLKYASNKNKLAKIFLSNIEYKKEIIDQVIICKYNKPYSFTGENVLEIICHANRFIIKKLFSLFLKLNFRHAENGEFTKRAFINNKINLVQAESINTLIKNKNFNYSEKIIKNVLNFSSNKFINIKNKLIEIIGNIEINIDYPEYDDVKKITYTKIKNLNSFIEENIANSINEYLIFSKTIDKPLIVIAGGVNAGKSSLFNKIIKYEKAIVTNIPGTTRDPVDSLIEYKNQIINISDTAGLRNSKNIIENIGIKKTYELIKKANLVIYLIDISKKNFISDNKIIEEIKKINKNIFIFFNKCDLLKNNQIKKNNFISIKNNEISMIYHLINEKLFLLKNNKSDLLIINERQLLICKEIQNIVKTINKELEKNIPLEMVSLLLKQIYQKINRLLGIEYEDDLLNEIFNAFCLGK